MVRRIAFGIVLLATIGCAALSLVSLRSAKAQAAQNSSATPVRPNEGAVIGGPNAAAYAAPPSNLQCQGCHGPGKQLRYLAGSLFHNEPHKGYEHSFHAQAKQNGAKAAACRDCHTRNGDMSTMLPAIDPKSTINRANIAETCGRCHGRQVRDVVGNFAYYLGINRMKPKIARFGYAEKAEYWAVIWGTFIMGLALLSVIFDPDVYPVNFAFIDGRVSEELYREEHELDFERIQEQSRSEETNAEPPSEEQPDTPD